MVNVVKKSQGIILATGPAGSGKTTILSSLLQHNAMLKKNYVTIEDMKNMIAAGISIGEPTQAARQQGMRTILHDVREKVDRDQTTMDEVLRVLGPQVIE